MGILFIQTDEAAQITNPNVRRVKIISSDNLSTVIGAGYLNPTSLQGYTIQNTDIIDMWYGATGDANSILSPGTYAEFLPSISNGIITLALQAASQAGPEVVTTATSSATPGTIRSITGKMTESATTMTSGNLVGVRGEVDAVGASGGFLYGAQGKVIPTGTLSGSSWTAGVFGQLDISAATINAGQTAVLWGDYGATSGTISDASGMRGVSMTNTTAAVLNAQDYRYGNATYLLELAGAGGTLNYYLDAGTSAGSAGDAAHCAAQKVIRIEVNGVAVYIPAFTQNT